MSKRKPKPEPPPELNVWIYGAGGHGSVVADLLMSLGLPPDYLAFVDDDPEAPRQVMGVRVHRTLPAEPGRYVVAIGDNQVRRDIAQDLEAAGWKAALWLCHRTATTTNSLELSLGRNSVICAGAHVGPRAVIGRDVIINTHAIVEHDCTVGDGAHVAPGAILCGDVDVGQGCLIGAGAVVLPGVRVPDDTLVGAGAVVTQGTQFSSLMVAGVPARSLTANERLEA